MNDDEIFQSFVQIFDDVDDSGFPSHRPLLAHYTSLGNLEKILKSEEVWLSNPLLMNDLEEVRFGILRGTNLVHDSAVLHDACGTSTRAGLFRNAYDEFYSRFENDHAFDTYVFCLSEHESTDFDGALSMWRGYGSNGHGAAIVFDTKQLSIVDAAPLIVAKVRYGSTDQRIAWLEGLMVKFSGLLQNTPLPDDKLRIAAYALFERIKLFALFSKHAGFREEKEWRVVYAPERDPDRKLSSMFNYAIGLRGAEPKLRLKIAPIEGFATDDMSLDKLTERIILGPCISSPMAKNAVLRMLGLLNKSVLSDRVHVSTIPFRAN